MNPKAVLVGTLLSAGGCCAAVAQSQVVDGASPEALPLEELLGIRAFDLKRVLDMEPGFLDPDGEHVHDSTISSVGISELGDVDMKKINEWIGTIRREKGVDIYRMKGVLAIDGSDQKFVFQGVHMLFSGEPLDEWKEGEARLNKLVFIGKKLDREELTAGFKSCLTTKA